MKIAEISEERQVIVTMAVSTLVVLVLYILR